MRKLSRSLISLRMRCAISRCLAVSFASSAPNQAPAWAIDRRATSEMLSRSILTASASGFSRSPRQVSHGLADWYFDSSSRTQALSVSRQRRYMFGMTPSNGLAVR